MSVKAVVFDIGGVLEVNPVTGWRERWARRLELQSGKFERCLDRIWGPGSVGAVSLEEVERRTADAFGLNSAGVAELMDDARAEYVGTPNRDLADYFRSLRPVYKTGILSNSFVGAREREQKAYGFEGMCDVIVCSHEVGRMKPDPPIYELVCERLRVAPGEAVLLDDVEENVAGARAIGMRAVTFVSNSQAIADLEAHLAS